LANPSDVGLLTSTRTMTRFLVRVAENSTTPPTPPPAGHLFYPLAQFSRPVGSAIPGNPSDNNSITDMRVTGLSMPLLVKRLATIESVLLPVITSIAPSLVLPGQPNPIVINGKNLDLGGATVMLGKVAGEVIPPTSSTALAVMVPVTADAGSYHLTVQTVIGTATSLDLLVIQPLPSPPTFVPVGGSLAQINPVHAATGTSITLNGANFTGVTRVTFNNIVNGTPEPALAIPGFAPPSRPGSSVRARACVRPTSVGRRCSSISPVTPSTSSIPSRRDQPRSL
jgi:hypothetical protein